jgi:hypothetical protein
MHSPFAVPHVALACAACSLSADKQRCDGKERRKGRKKKEKDREKRDVDRIVGWY